MKLKLLKKIVLPILISSTLLTTPLVIVSCSKTNDKKPEQTPPNNSTGSNDNILSSAGGNTSSGLLTSHYKEVIDKLELTPSSDITQLSNTILTNKIQANEGFGNFEIKIVDGSDQANGILIINLKGDYNNQAIDQRIEISNFNKYQIASTYRFNSINYNQSLWFDNSQPISNITNNLSFTSNETLLKEIFSNTSINISINNSEHTFKINELNNYIKISSIAIDSSSSTPKLNITFKKELKVYKNNNWVIETNNDTIRLATNTSNNFTIPTFEELKLFIVNQLTLDEVELSKYYASYFYGNYFYDNKNDDNLSKIIDFISNFDELINKYKNSYLVNKIMSLALTENDPMVASDINHSLKFSIFLIDQDNPHDYSISKSLSFNGFKNINDTLLNQSYQNDFLLKETDSFANNIKTLYKNQILQVLDSNISVQENNLSLPPQLIEIFNIDTTNTDLINKLNNRFNTMQIFGSNFKIDELGKEIQANILNASCGLFSLNDEYNAFFIKDIRFSKTNSLNIVFSKHQSRDAVNIDIKTEISIGIEGDIIYQPTNIHFTLNRSDIS